MSLTRLVQAHREEFDQYLNTKLNNFPVLLKTTTTEVFGKSCLLTIKSLEDIIQDIDENQILDEIFEKAPEQFSVQQFFRDLNNVEFGVITTWNDPQLSLDGSNSFHTIKHIMMLETFELGHDFEVEIYVLI